MTSEDYFKLVGQRIIQIIHEKGLTKNKVIKRAELEWRQFKVIENGTGKIELRAYAKIADVLGVDVRELFIFGEKVGEVRGSSRGRNITTVGK